MSKSNTSYILFFQQFKKYIVQRVSIYLNYMLFNMHKYLFIINYIFKVIEQMLDAFYAKYDDFFK